MAVPEEAFGRHSFGARTGLGLSAGTRERQHGSLQAAERGILRTAAPLRGAAEETSGSQLSFLRAVVDEKYKRPNMIPRPPSASVAPEQID
jgi:hypothetical protein